MFVIFPPRANTFVPGDFALPNDLNHSAPFITICATLANVSTLLIIVGLPKSPLTAGNGGLFLDIPLFPSIEAIRAVSSPHTNAPAPSLISRSKLNPDSNIFSPNSPSSLA